MRAGGRRASLGPDAGPWDNPPMEGRPLTSVKMLRWTLATVKTCVLLVGTVFALAAVEDRGLWAALLVLAIEAALAIPLHFGVRWVDRRLREHAPKQHTFS